jgi:hypothetical protein
VRRVAGQIEAGLSTHPMRGGTMGDTDR